MAHRTFKIVTVVSTVMLGMAVLLFLTGYVLNPWNHYLSFNKDSHVAVWGRGFDSRIVLFNDAEYGPYRGSIIGIVDADGNIQPPLEREESFGDSFGIYYRYFQWPEYTRWTLRVSMWYPILVFAVLPVMRLLVYMFHRRAANAAEPLRI